MELLWCLILKNYTQNSTTKIQDNIIHDLRIVLPLDKILQQYNQNSSVKEYIRILNGNQDINETESISVSVTIENIPEHIIFDILPILKVVDSYCGWLILPTRFGGCYALLLTVLLHSSLHRRYGHVLP